MKRFFKENRVFAMLMVVVLACFLVMLGLLIRYFYAGIGESKYGDRLKGIEKIKISSNLKKEIKTKYELDDATEEVNFDLEGKVLYINIVYKNTTQLVDAESKAVKILDEFSSEIKSFYDIQFMLVAPDDKSTDTKEGFTIMGAKNAVSSNVVWNNNTATE